jgi:cell division protein FtsQ
MGVELAMSETPTVHLPRPGAAAAALGGLALIAYAAAYSVHEAGPAVQRLQVAGDLQQVTLSELRATAEPLLGVGFFAVDLEQIRTQLEALPWIARVQVSRAWPGVLRIRVWEHVPVALWRDDTVLSAAGELFRPGVDAVPDGLPQLHGPDGQTAAVLAAYRVLHEGLSDLPLAPAELWLDARGEWFARTGNAVELRLGRQAPHTRLALIRDVVWPALSAEWDEVAYVDLRYSNGFAVGRRGTTDTHGERAAPPAAGGGARG